MAFDPLGTSSGAQPPTYGSQGTQAYQQWLQQGQNLTDIAAPFNLGSQADELAALLGISPDQLQQEYQAFMAQQPEWGSQFANRRVGGLLGGIETAIGHPMSLNEWVGSQITSVMGQYARYEPILNAYRLAWENQYGASMPPELTQQMLKQIESLDPTALGQLDGVLENWLQAYSTAMSSSDPGQRQSSLSTALSKLSFGPLDTTVNNYVTANPPLSTAEAKIASQRQTEALQFLNTYGLPASSDMVSKLTSGADQIPTLSKLLDFARAQSMDVTPELVTTLMGMPYSDPSSGSAQEGTAGAWMLAQPSNIKGLNVGQKVNAWNALDTPWQQEFNRDPNSQELLWAQGKSKEDIADFVRNSPSNIDGVSIGQKNDYTNFISSLGTSGATTHAFSMGVDDSLIADLHQHMQSMETGHAHPGAM